MVNCKNGEYDLQINLSEYDKKRRRWIKFVRAETEFHVHFSDAIPLGKGSLYIGNRCNALVQMLPAPMWLAMNLTSKHRDQLEGNSFLLE